MIDEFPFNIGLAIGQVKNKYNGFLCNSLDLFVNSIDILRENKTLLKEMEINSNKRAKELFDRDKNFEKLYKIYYN